MRHGRARVSGAGSPREDAHPPATEGSESPLKGPPVKVLGFTEPRRSWGPAWGGTASALWCGQCPGGFPAGMRRRRGQAGKQPRREHGCRTDPQGVPVPSAAPSRYLVLQQALGAHHVVKDVLSHVRVHGRERVIEEVDVGASVHGPGQAHALLLATGQVDALGDKQRVVSQEAPRLRGALPGAVRPTGLCRVPGFSVTQGRSGRAPPARDCGRQCGPPGKWAGCWAGAWPQWALGDRPQSCSLWVAPGDTAVTSPVRLLPTHCGPQFWWAWL